VRFVGIVHEAEEPQTPAAADAIEQPRPALALPDRPSIAVLPFANMSDDSQQDYFADGMAEEIITALSRLRWLFVIAGYSSFAYKGRAIDVRQVGRELGVRYVLEGSVRKSANHVRITGQLIDASSGAHIWADRFDGGIEDIFDLQDQVTASVVGAIAPKMEQAEIVKIWMLTITTCEARRAFIGRRRTPTAMRCSCFTRPSNSTLILPRHTAWPRGATLGAR
jgi:TolB-like protein